MFTCNQLVIRTPDISRAREFYTDKLGLTLLGGRDNYFAAVAGEMRFSFFKLQEASPVFEGEAPIAIMLRTDDVQSEFARLTANGVTILEEVQEAPGFMHFFTVADPDGNPIHICQYLRDLLASY